MQSSQFNAVLKICSHYEWLKTCLKKKISIPVSIEFDIANCCNYACFNCTWNEYRNRKRVHMSRKDALKIIRSCADVGIKAIVFSGGGEPLLHPAISEAIRFAKKQSLDIGLFTNGLLLKGKVADTIAECCDWVRFNLGGVTPEVYTKYHGISYSNFEKVKKNLIEFNMLIKRKNYQTSVGVGSTLNYNNVNDVAKMVEFVYLSGCEYFQGKHDFELLSDTAYLMWWKNTVQPLMSGLEQKYAPKQFKIDYTHTDYTRKPISKHCYVHHLATAINACGDVVYCKRLRDKADWYLGNAKRQSLRTIFTGSRNRKLCQEVVPQNCGVICPYLELNDFIASSMYVKHINFF